MAWSSWRCCCCTAASNANSGERHRRDRWCFAQTEPEAAGQPASRRDRGRGLRHNHRGDIRNQRTLADCLALRADNSARIRSIIRRLDLRWHWNRTRPLKSMLSMTPSRSSAQLRSPRRRAMWKTSSTASCNRRRSRSGAALGTTDGCGPPESTGGVKLTARPMAKENGRIVSLRTAASCLVWQRRLQMHSRGVIW